MFPNGGGGYIFFMVRQGRPNFCQFFQTNVYIFPDRGASTPDKGAVAPQPSFGATTVKET